MIPTPEETTSPASSTPAKSQRARPDRLLACELCQRRKVRCDRQSPCSNCVKANAYCVQATLHSRPRRRRFPERELLDRLRRYENLMRGHGIHFEALHPEAAGSSHPTVGSQGAAEAGGEGGDAATSTAATKTEAVNLWDAMNQKSDGSQSDDENDSVNLPSIPHAATGETVDRQAFDQFFASHDSLLFDTHVQDIDVKTLHPGPGHILKLWQIYLDNVNPLLKVTHTPTLQPKIIDAAVNLASVPAALDALMFGVYCTAIISIEDLECQSLFGSPKETLLKGYQFACKQALIKMAVLRSRKRDCLTAFFLYMVSHSPGTDPRALAPMLGIAIRIAQSMGLDNENKNSKCTALEAEMRRRLWWALVAFDNRKCEMSHHGSTSLLPIWQIHPVSNLYDSDVLGEGKSAPEARERPTEAIFTVVRSEICEFIRDSAFHLSFTNPSLMPLAKDAQLSVDQRHARIADFEDMIEQKYLRACNPDDPLHFMTIWSSRTLLARLHVLQHYATSAQPNHPTTDAERDTAIWYAMRMIECDTRLAQAPHVKGFRWHAYAHFPAPAKIHIIQSIRRRPGHPHASRCWDVMSENFAARFGEGNPGISPFLMVLSKFVLQAWDAYQMANSKQEQRLEPPPIVSYVQQRASERCGGVQNMQTATEDIASMDISKAAAPASQGLAQPQSAQFIHSDAVGSFSTGEFAGLGDQDGALDFDLGQFDLTTMDWNPLLALGSPFAQ